MNKVVLLADPNSNAWNFAEKIQDYISQVKKIKIPLDALEIKEFDNNELDLHVKTNMRRREVYYIHDSTKNPQYWEQEVRLVTNLLLLSSVEKINYVFPEIKYNRQDRKHKPRVPISAIDLPTFLKQFWPVVREVFTMDLHAKQIEGFYFPIPLENIPSTPTLAGFLRGERGISDLEDTVLVAADKGDVDRVEELNNYLRLKNPPAFIYKQRNPETRKIDKVELIGNVKGKKVLIPDDLIDKGTTLCNGAELLIKNGATEVNCYATHGWFTKGTKIITDVFNRVIVSNTHNKDYGEGIDVMDVSSIFAEAIYRSQVGESISELWYKSF